MDSATRQSIFEPFFTTKQRGKGTGLGLATVYGTVKQCGGDIWVYSEPGRGTTFKLYFPRVSAPVTSPATRASPNVAATNGGETVLVVEDEAQVRDLTARMLRKLGYTCFPPPPAKRPYTPARTQAGDIALLITDVVMPGMSGKEVADALLGLAPGAQGALLSGYTENTVVHHGVLDSNVDFLAKPFTREDLARKVHEILSR